MKILHLIVLAFVPLLLCSCGEQENKEKLPQDGAALPLYEISEVAELGSVKYTIRQVIKGEDDNKIGGKNILFGSIAYVKAGVDMTKFSDDNVEIDKINGSIKVTLPHAKILSINIPQDSIKEIYHHSGTFRGGYDAKERQEVLSTSQDELEEKIAGLGIEKEAETNTKILFEDLLVRLGYQRQNIHIKFE
ncbi:MAG: DUF4230 domain-containing protein [Bacteroidales bacterium]|nr:DUF4230 domain-containing protein [Bacteroidales bacterium]